ncbi:hypothetical protein C3408_10530 [Candidatus Pantoea alvi]|nr:hypothetical protein C3408_10530 [Pantoea alvi]
MRGSKSAKSKASRHKEVAGRARMDALSALRSGHIIRAGTPPTGKKCAEVKALSPTPAPLLQTKKSRLQAGFFMLYG